MDGIEQFTGGERVASSLIICSRNRPQLLHDTIQSVLEGDSRPTEIVVVDQSWSRHQVVAGLRDTRCSIRYVHSRSVGLCRARNEGVAAARFDLLAFIDDDMLVAGHWYGALTGALVAAGPKAVVTGAVHPAPSDAGRGFVPALVTAAAPAAYAGRLNKDVLAAGNMAMWRSAIAEVGPFDERLGAGSRFPAADDNDFGFRLLEAGYSIHYVPEALVYHRAWRPVGEYLPLRWRYGRGKGGFYAKYASFRDPHLTRRAAADLASRFLNFPRRVLRSPRRAAGDLLYAAGIASGALEWWVTGQGRAPQDPPPRVSPAAPADPHHSG